MHTKNTGGEIVKGFYFTGSGLAHRNGANHRDVFGCSMVGGKALTTYQHKVRGVRKIYECEGLA